MNRNNSIRVSVVLPAYNSASCISYAIESIISQTFPYWELLIINEADSNDGTAEIIKKYMEVDGRIRLIQNKTKLGLAESLNEGIRQANGEYIARLDADDTSHPDRLKKQVDFLEAHPNIGVCGTWQHHYGSSDWYHIPPKDTEKCMAILLFDCNLCHSTVMIRKSVMLTNNLFYNKDSMVEDFELWSRMMQYTKIANIPEVLGEYCESENNITLKKYDEINKESAEIVKKSLERYLGVRVNEKEMPFIMEYKYPILDLQNKHTLISRIGLLVGKRRLRGLIYKINDANEKKHFCDNHVMRHVLHYLWKRELLGVIEFNSDIQDYSAVSEVFVL